MRDAGRIAATIEILADFDRRRVPLKTALADWARGARYAGAKDRAWISGLCLDVLRRRNSLSLIMGDAGPRACVFGALHFLWAMAPEALRAIAAEQHGPGALSEGENARLATGAPDVSGAPVHIAGDFPEWLTPHMQRAFGEAAAAEGAALASRADVDLRINLLKTDPDKALAALKSVRAEAIPILTSAARIAAPVPSERAPAVTVIPAFSKGWVEVQDLGSQLAAAAAGDVKGAQVLDYCAGGGGKTLALAAMMQNKGQIFATDDDKRRLAPIHERLKRSG
ncbi:MAG TPA: hypothetical protein VNH64_12450, partial [Parvularculaceae bacterium]|nr:hypothetical protein [Parvularculaceae bacterium]